MVGRRARDVLVVDDDAGIRRMLLSTLGRLGLSTDDAVDGYDALQRIAGSSYAVILIDMMMPRIDGPTFVGRLIETERLATVRPVVLLMTASSDRTALLPLGDRIQAVIAKPFDLIGIADVVKGCVDAYGSARKPATFDRDPGHAFQPRIARP